MFNIESKYWFSLGKKKIRKITKNQLANFSRCVKIFNVI